MRATSTTKMEKSIHLLLGIMLFFLACYSATGCDLDTFVRWRDRIAAAEKAALADKASRPTELVIFHDPSLAGPLFKLARLFEKTYPSCRVRRESSAGRVAARKVCDLGRTPDFIAVTDYQTIQQLLMPKYAEWFVCFARNEMVLAYRPHSRYHTEIHRDNWFEILARPDVTFGLTDPGNDPCGSRTSLVWKLASMLYRKTFDGQTIEDTLVAKVSPEHVRPTLMDLLPVLCAGTVDYAFVYRSVAEQHRLQFIELRSEINLGDSQRSSFYERAQVEFPNPKNDAQPIVHTGRPILFAFTIPRTAPHRLAARRFAEFLLSEAGATVLASEGHTVIKGGRIGFLPDSIPIVTGETR